MVNRNLPHAIDMMAAREAEAKDSTIILRFYIAPRCNNISRMHDELRFVLLFAKDLRM
jgi:hypothetical protein